MVPYMSFYEFSKILNCCSESIGASLWFYRNRRFASKTDRNSLISGRDHNILDRLYIMVSYMSFYGFSKFLVFRSKSIRVRLQLYRKSSLCGKNWPKLRISWSRHPYSRSVIYNSHVYEFLWVLNFLNFRSKSIGVRLRCCRKSKVCAKTDRNSVILGRDPPPYSGLAIHNSLIYEFLWVLKIFKFSLKIHRCYATILPKIISLRRKLTETPYLLVMTPIFWIDYT
jgi:hypothetical protein